MAEIVPEPPAGFPATDWSRVTAGDRAALARPGPAYWYPIYAFIRRRGHGADEALDLAQGYFARLLEGGLLAAADRGKGRFRDLLRADCGHYLADRRDFDAAQKRGGGVVVLPLDLATAEGRYAREPADDLTPDRLLDRAWALALLDDVLAALAAEYAGSGRAALFDALRPALTGDPDAPANDAIAARLGMTRAAVQQAAARLRRRYKAILRETIAATLGDPDPTDAAVDDELRDLLAALGR